MEEAKRLFVDFTAGTGDINRLYGPTNAPCRAQILSALSGECVPKSRAAWWVFRKAILTLYGVTGDCIVAEDRNLQAAVLRESRRNNEAFCDARQPAGFP